MSLDTGITQEKHPIPLTCYRCHKTRHKAPDCPLKFDIRTLSVDEIEMELKVRKDMSEVETPLVETEVASPEDFVQNNE